MSNIVSLAAVRDQRKAEATARNEAAKPDWGDTIQTACAYARMVRADHDAESARIHFEALQRGLSGWNAADDLIERTRVNNLEWDRYISVLRHVASLPARNRREASDKRNTVGKGWLAPDPDDKEYKPGTLGSCFAAMRSGCLADDHLFPPSLRLAR